MRIIRTIEGFREWRRELPKERNEEAGVAIRADRVAEAARTVGFVPTMGALHAGHRRLIEASVAANHLTAVSIFVNPLQFGPGEDLARYPRPFEADVELCREAGVDAVFAPDPGTFYAPDHATHCEVEGLDRHLCGASRPGHFRGVCTVVLKLFHIAKPDRAYFGQKDIQQALILRRMVRDLSVDLEMEIVETVREPSGLALSSRNAYLGGDEKVRAAALSRALFLARDAWLAGERSGDALRAMMRKEIEASSPDRIDYVEAVSQARLEPLETVDAPAALAVAAYYGRTRLIDNVLLG